MIFQILFENTTATLDGSVRVVGGFGATHNVPKDACLVTIQGNGHDMTPNQARAVAAALNIAAECAEKGRR